MQQVALLLLTDRQELYTPSSVSIADCNIFSLLFHKAFLIYQESELVTASDSEMSISPANCSSSDVDEVVVVVVGAVVSTSPASAVCVGSASDGCPLHPQSTVATASRAAAFFS